MWYVALFRDPFFALLRAITGGFAFPFHSCKPSQPFPFISNRQFLAGLTKTSFNVPCSTTYGSSLLDRVPPSPEVISSFLYYYTSP